MSAIKLVEDYAVASLRRDVRDSLIMAGEQCVLLQMYHPEVDKDAPRCANCQDDIYTSGEGDCDVCYGTSVHGGIKAARKVWGLFSDHVAGEMYTKQGAWPPDAREIQTEAFPILLEHDVVVRIREWDRWGRPAAVEGFYNIAAVTRVSLRTGTRSGQQGWDVVGQRAAITLVNHSLPITRLPVLHQHFDEVSYSPYTPPPPVQEEPVAQPFTHSHPVPEAVWTVVHPLDHYPSVTVIVNQELVEPDVFYPAPDTVRIEFATPTAGIAVLV